MPTIELQTLIGAPRPLVFDIARDVELHAKTVPWTQETAIGAMTTGKLVAGDVVVFEAIHFGVKQRLSAKITAYEYPEFFVDEMISGAFSELKHRHQFGEVSSCQTLMTDLMSFTSPLGIFGKVADVVFLKEYMRDFLVRRNVNLKRIAELAHQSGGVTDE